MSWLDRINSGMTITTGDGKSYSPNWMNAQKSVEYNISEFEFPEIAGTLVYRGTPMGRKFPLEFYFQGDNHLDTAEAFETSANDNRPWVISHPLYNEILVHPVSLTFDNTKLNTSKVTGTVIETISDIYPKSNLDPVDQIEQQQQIASDAQGDAFVASIPTPNSSDVSELQSNNKALYDKSILSATTTAASEELRSLYAASTSAISTATTEPLLAIRATQRTIEYPAQFETTVSNRMNTLLGSFNTLLDGVVNIARNASKFIFENNAGSTIGAMCLAVSTPLEDDYTNRTDVLKQIANITNSYNAYLLALDELQTENNGKTDSFIPSENGIRQLTRLVNYTIANLFSIALGAKQERIVILTSASNPISLTHRFYGLEETDENLELFISQNNIGINEMLEIKAGRTIIYYV